MTLRVAIGLEQIMVKGLCPKKTASLDDNLHAMHFRHNHPNIHIWNCDESKTQARRNGNGYILARRGIWSVHIVMHDNSERLYVLSCIDASRSCIPSFKY